MDLKLGDTSNEWTKQKLFFNLRDKKNSLVITRYN